MQYNINQFKFIPSAAIFKTHKTSNKNSVIK